MSTTQTTNEQPAPVPSAGMVDTRLEVIFIPVSDVERSKRFYAALDWKLDADFAAGDWRGVQMTPPGSQCSIIFGKGVTSAAPGSAQGLMLVADDLEAARGALLAAGVGASEVFHFEGPLHATGTEGRVPGPDPQASPTARSCRSAIPTATAGSSRRSGRGSRGAAWAPTSRP